MITKLELNSNHICYGRMPRPDRIVEQKLIIQADGKACLSRYSYGNGYPYELSSTETNQLDRKHAGNILRETEAFFTEDYQEDRVFDVGIWGLTITFEDGTEKHYSGPLLESIQPELCRISNLIRSALDNEYIWAFTG